tara:strand:+ start:4054 stop:4179 length:126 start_codon:yes stop_codon:yes gene_type:complete
MVKKKLRQNLAAKELRTPKFRSRVIINKKVQSEKKRVKIKI